MTGISAFWRGPPLRGSAVGEVSQAETRDGPIPCDEAPPRVCAQHETPRSVKHACGTGPLVRVAKEPPRRRASAPLALPSFEVRCLWLNASTDEVSAQAYFGNLPFVTPLLAGLGPLLAFLSGAAQFYLHLVPDLRPRVAYTATRTYLWRWVVAYVWRGSETLLILRIFALEVRCPL